MEMSSEKKRGKETEIKYPGGFTMDDSSLRMPGMAFFFPAS